jgi:hypothetical protein
MLSQAIALAAASKLACESDANVPQASV